MCIIVYKPAGLPLPSDKILEECHYSNPDGSGWMMRARDGRVVINKGFARIGDLLESLDSIRGVYDRDLAIHFRFATHGNRTAGETHPFPITNKIHLLRQRRIVCDKALMHNGILADMKHKDISLSDTMCLVKLISGSDEFAEPIQEILNRGKFLIMDHKETRLYGVFIKDNGYYYSNTSYIPTPYYRTVAAAANVLSNVTKGMSYKEQEELIEWYNTRYGTRYFSIEDLVDDLEILAEQEEDKELADKKRKNYDLYDY